MEHKKLTLGAAIIGLLIFGLAVTILTIFPPAFESKPTEKEKVYISNSQAEQLMRSYQIEIVDSTLILYDKYRYVGEVKLSKTENATLDSLIYLDNE
jgi:hypothetical protein